MLLMNITFGIMETGSAGRLREYSWISVLLISLSFFLLLYHYVLGERDEKLTEKYFGKNLYWFVVAAIYAFLTLAGIIIRIAANTAYGLYERLFGHEMVDSLLELNLFYIGAAGAVFCLMWVGREMILFFIERQIEKRKSP